MNKKDIIKSIVQTLETIPVSGYENHNKMMGIYMALRELAKEEEENDSLSDDK